MTGLMLRCLASKIGVSRHALSSVSGEENRGYLLAVEQNMSRFTLRPLRQCSTMLMAIGLVVVQGCGGDVSSDAAETSTSRGGADGAGGAVGAGGDSQAGNGGGGERQCVDHGDCAEGERCFFGRCLVPNECNESAVTCSEPMPTCPSGQTPAVVDGCWDGCVPIDTCVDLDGCEMCEREGQLCRALIYMGTSYSCFERPVSCGEVVTCECVAEAACGPQDVFTPSRCVRVEGDWVYCRSSLE
jgi:hypothetical protein